MNPVLEATLASIISMGFLFGIMLLLVFVVKGIAFINNKK